MYERTNIMTRFKRERLYKRLLFNVSTAILHVGFVQVLVFLMRTEHGLVAGGRLVDVTLGLALGNLPGQLVVVQVIARHLAEDGQAKDHTRHQSTANCDGHCDEQNRDLVTALHARRTSQAGVKVVDVTAQFEELRRVLERCSGRELTVEALKKKWSIMPVIT